MKNFLILVQIILPYVIAGIAISIISALIVNYLNKEIKNDKERI